MEDVERKIQSLEKVLFIFDNASDPRLIEDYLPNNSVSPANNYYVIVTMRGKCKWPNKYLVEKLQPINDEEAKMYIRNIKFFAHGEQ